MKFFTVLTNTMTHERKDKEMTQQELTSIVGEYVVSRAVELGQTNTTIINKGQTYKMQIKAVK